MLKYRGTCSGPKWVGMSRAVKKAAFLLELDLKIEVDSGFFTEDIRFEVSGSTPIVKSFKRLMEASIKEYNS
jgi:hypothetical protein